MLRYRGQKDQKRGDEIDNIGKDARLTDKKAGLFNSRRIDHLCSDVLKYVEIVALASRTRVLANNDKIRKNRTITRLNT